MRNSNILLEGAVGHAPFYKHLFGCARGPLGLRCQDQQWWLKCFNQQPMVSSQFFFSLSLSLVYCIYIYIYLFVSYTVVVNCTVASTSWGAHLIFGLFALVTASNKLRVVTGRWC